jgi:hypothetical protein
VNHPVLIKTSDQPSFSSANFFAVHFSRGSPIIRYQPCAKSEPKAKSSWWNNKENNEYKKFVKATQKKKKKENKTGH